MKKFLPASIRGFTLVELLVAMSIIGILSVVGLVSFQGIRAKALDGKIKADLNAVKMAYEMNYDSAGGYKPLEGRHFASGAIPTQPTQPDPSPYPCAVGPDQPCITKSTEGYKISARLSDNTAMTVTSDQGTPVAAILDAAKCPNFKIRDPDDGSIRSGYSGETQSCYVAWLRVNGEQAEDSDNKIWVKCASQGSADLGDPILCTTDDSGCTADPNFYQTGNMDYYNTRDDAVSSAKGLGQIELYNIPGNGVDANGDGKDDQCGRSRVRWRRIKTSVTLYKFVN